MIRGAPLLLASCFASEAPREEVANPSSLTDSSGAEFGWACSPIECEVVVEPLTPALPSCPVGKTPNYGFVASRFMSIVAGCSNTSVSNWIRPAACAHDDDCPQIFQFSTDYRYGCVQGLCQNVDRASFPSDQIIGHDAFLLCFAPIPREVTLAPGTPEEVNVSTWVNEACPDGLEAPCRSALPVDCIRP